LSTARSILSGLALGLHLADLLLGPLPQAASDAQRSGARLKLAETQEQADQHKKAIANGGHLVSAVLFFMEAGIDTNETPKLQSQGQDDRED